MNINIYYEGVYSIGDRLNCMFKGGTEDEYIIKEIHENYIIVDKDLGSEDAISVNGKIVDDFNTLDNYLFYFGCTSNSRIL